MSKFTVLLSLVLLVSFTTRAQDTSFHFSFNHVALNVRDADKAVRFYKAVLRLQEITNRTKVDGIRWMSLGQGKELHLISTVKEPFTVNRAIHFCISTPQFAQLMLHLDSIGQTYTDWLGKPHSVSRRADGVQQIYVQDADGYTIEINDNAQ